MVTDSFYRHLAASLKNQGRGEEFVSGAFFLAVGSGLAEWDSLPASYDRSIDQLVAEVARKAISVDNMAYLDEIRFDRRLYFGITQQATDLNYDFCAHCFGRDRSQR